MKRFLNVDGERGFSLLEMSVALAIVGLLGLAFWKFMPVARDVDETRPAAAQLEMADEAIIGFVMAQSRLPCPDTDSPMDGLENVGGSGCAASTGAFPYRTLGVRFPVPLRYGVYQDSAQRLTKKQARHAPWLPPPVTALTEWPLEGGTGARYIYDGSEFSGLDYGGYAPPDLSGVGAATLKGMSTLADVDLSRTDTTPSLSAVSEMNGLDFCAALREIAPSPGAHLRSNNIPVAYAVAHPGARDAKGDGNPFDGSNAAGNDFEAPLKAATDEYDDQVIAVGFSELSARLTCPSALSRANAAGHTARAAYDTFLFSLAFLQYRAFALDAAFSDLQQANAGVTLAAINLAGAIASGVMVTAGGAMTAEEGVGVVLVTLGGILAALSIAEAVWELVDAISGAEDAIEGVNDAMNARIEAEVYADKMRVVANVTAQRAVTLDNKGLLP